MRVAKNICTQNKNGSKRSRVGINEEKAVTRVRVLSEWLSG